MGKIIGIFACILIVGLDVAAGILGFKAEAAQNEAKEIRIWIFECREPSHDAYVLCLAAATLLGIAHVLANVFGCCYACFTTASPSKKLSKACLSFTWIIVLVALPIYVSGIISNHKTKASCGFSHFPVLKIAGILSMIHPLFAVAYCVANTTGFSSN